MHFSAEPYTSSSWFSWSALTWFGDSGLLLPAAAALGLAFLIAPGSRAMAVRWAIAFGGVGLLTLVTKIAFMGWGIGSAAADFTGLSGHSALSAAFWPVVAWLVGRNRRQPMRGLLIVSGFMFAAAIGFSRIPLDAHSPSEVLAGLLVGFLGSAWFMSQSRESRSPLRIFVSGAMVFVAGLVVFQHGRPAPTTQLIEVTVVRLLGVTEPYTRADLHTGRI
ncbi:phosphatase PAP2 family protein [Xylophilus sp. GOD-11R]|uniref:phosphatase PAP2 family protein n=1 Tax=Xylophilus sp. GOD-11R TaxID=3089814 RepID=UPI00298BFB2B|nr:phosphatase PAP2 family protein [Xylophilus sp. GOD-11R]WPB58670.1 phosphatase PAP2 family protein [Xylophilus sp. GOD-11R]